MPFTPPPSLPNRYPARLTDLSHGDLLGFAAALSAKHSVDADTLLAALRPTPEWVRNGVLVSTDLTPALLGHLHASCADVKSVCTAWRTAWDNGNKGRVGIQMERLAYTCTVDPVRNPPPRFFVPLTETRALLDVGGGRADILNTTSVHNVWRVGSANRDLCGGGGSSGDHPWFEAAAVGIDAGGTRRVFGVENRTDNFYPILYVASYAYDGELHLRPLCQRFKAGGIFEDYHRFRPCLAVAPNDCVYVPYCKTTLLGTTTKRGDGIACFTQGTLALANGFHAEEAKFQYITAITVCGDALVVADRDAKCITVLALDGEVLRRILGCGGSFLNPGVVCTVAGQLYMIEDDEGPNEAKSLRCVYALTIDGVLLQRFLLPSPPRALWPLNGKLVVVYDERGDLDALCANLLRV